jgi:hypothetical protein
MCEGILHKKDESGEKGTFASVAGIFFILHYVHTCNSIMNNSYIPIPLPTPCVAT